MIKQNISGYLKSQKIGFLITEKILKQLVQFFLEGKTTGLYNSGSIHFAIKDIILKNHLSVINKYEYLIYTRFDQYYTSNHFESISNKSKIYIPDGEDYFGIGDRHAVISSDLAEKRFFRDLSIFR